MKAESYRSGPGAAGAVAGSLGAACTPPPKASAEMAVASQGVVLFIPEQSEPPTASADARADARAPSGLARRPRWGQVLRGGRSWPPETNSGSGARSAGKAAVAGGAWGSVTASVGGAAAEQQEAQKLHLSVPSWSAAEAPWSWTALAVVDGASPPCSWSWSYTCTVAATTWSWAVAGPHSMAAAIAPRIGSTNASRTRSQMRRDFTEVRLARAGKFKSCLSLSRQPSACIVDLPTVERSSAGRNARDPLDIPIVGRPILTSPHRKDLSMITFQVPDMTCGHCAGTIAKAIAAEDAGARVEFDIPGHLVRVAPVGASAAELEFAIREAGYSPSMQAEVPPRAGGCGCGCASSKTVDMTQGSTPAQGGCCT